MKKLNIENINSKELVNFYIDEKSIIPKLDYLVHNAFKIPVYLVDEELMDLLYPPYKRKILNEKNIKELLNSIKERDTQERDFEKDTERIKDIMNRFYEKSYEKTTNQAEVMVAVGLYIHSLNQNVGTNSENFKTLLNKINLPCIVICPERVVEWAERLCISTKTVFELVYFHELAHSYIYSDLRDYQKPWYRIVEEAYCNAVAFERFNTEECIYEASIAIDEQPVEYRGYTFFATKFFLLSPYYPFDFDEFDEIYYILRRFYFRNRILYPHLSIDLRYFSRLWKHKKVEENFFVWLALSILEDILG